MFLDGRDVVEGTRVGLYATVNTPPTATDLVIHLSNGQSITIPVGAGSGLVEVSIRPDDPYIQGREVIDIRATGANGGDYDQLDVDQSTAITVVDDQDLTRVGITGPDSVREGDITAPYTVTLERPGQTPVVVTFQYSGVAQNGVDFTGVASITIPAGQSSQTFTIQTLLDQLAEGSELYNIRIESITGAGGIADLAGDDFRFGRIFLQEFLQLLADHRFHRRRRGLPPLCGLQCQQGRGSGHDAHNGHGR